MGLHCAQGQTALVLVRVLTSLEMAANRMRPCITRKNMKMKKVMFSGQRSEFWSPQLSSGVKRISTKSLLNTGKIIEIALWWADHSGVRILSRMHDVSERAEVGVLEFLPA